MGLGRLRAWDLAMASPFGSWRSLQDGRTSLAAGILRGLSELGDIDAWMDMGRLLSTMLLVSPPDLASLVRYLGGTGGRYALRTLTELIKKSRTVESSGEHTLSPFLGSRGLGCIALPPPSTPSKWTKG
jgi:hypothetical protein